MKKRCQAFLGMVSSFLNYLAASRWLRKTIERTYVVPFLSVALGSSNVMRQSSRQVLVVGGVWIGAEPKRRLCGPQVLAWVLTHRVPAPPSTGLQKERVT